MNKKVKNLIAAILAVATVTTAGVLMTGCSKSSKSTGGSSSSVSSKTTTTAPASATEKNGKTTSQSSNTQASADPQTQNSVADTQAQQSDTTTQTNTVDQSAALSDGYLSENEAMIILRGQLGTAAQVTNYYKGYAPDGLPAWVCTVLPVTNGTSADTVTYYVGYGFCYPETTNDVESYDDDATYAGVTESYAKTTALNTMGNPYTFDSIWQGQDPTGQAAWVVVLRKDVGPAQDTINFYVSDSFAYAG